MFLLIWIAISCTEEPRVCQSDSTRVVDLSGITQDQTMAVDIVFVSRIWNGAFAWGFFVGNNMYSGSTSWERLDEDGEETAGCNAISDSFTNVPTTGDFAYIGHVEVGDMEEWVPFCDEDGTMLLRETTVLLNGEPVPFTATPDYRYLDQLTDRDLGPAIPADCVLLVDL